MSGEPDLITPRTLRRIDGFEVRQRSERRLDLVDERAAP